MPAATQASHGRLVARVAAAAAPRVVDDVRAQVRPRVAARSGRSARASTARTRAAPTSEQPLVSQPLAAIHSRAGATPIWFAGAVVADHRAHGVRAVAVVVARRERRAAADRGRVEPVVVVVEAAAAEVAAVLARPAPGGRTARRCRCWRRRCPRRGRRTATTPRAPGCSAMPHSTALIGVAGPPVRSAWGSVVRLWSPRPRDLGSARRPVCRTFGVARDQDRVGDPERRERRRLLEQAAQPGLALGGRGSAGRTRISHGAQSFIPQAALRSACSCRTAQKVCLPTAVDGFVAVVGGMVLQVHQRADRGQEGGPHGCGDPAAERVGSTRQRAR